MLGDDFGGAFWTKVSLASLRATFSISNSALVISRSRRFFRGGIDDAIQREVGCSNDRRTGGTALRSGLAEGERFRVKED